MPEHTTEATHHHHHERRNMSKTAAKKKAGRPKGSPNKDADIAPGKLTRCHACGSTERSKYTSRVTHAYRGTTPDGDPYTHIVWRRCICTDCGQHRVDKHHENRPKG